MNPAQERASAMIYDRDMKPLFVITIYGVRSLAFVGPDTGGTLIKRALRVCGLNPDDFQASLFATWEGP